MKKVLKDIAKTVFFLGVGLFLIWLAIKDFTPEQWRRIRDTFYEADYWPVLPVFIISIASNYARAIRWKLLLEPLGYRPHNNNMFCAVMIGYLTNMAIPRLGEIARCGILTRQERIPMNEAIGTVLAERIVDLITLLILIFLTIAIQYKRVEHFFYINIWEKIQVLFSTRYIIYVFFIILGIVIVSILISYLFRQTVWYQKMIRFLRSIKQGFLMAFRLQKRGLFVLYTFLIWGCYLLMIVVGFQCFQATSVLGIKPALSVLSFGSIGMMLTQGGLGAYQLLVQETLRLYDIAGIYGFSFGWLSWLLQAAIVLLLGLGSLMALPFLRRRRV